MLTFGVNTWTTKAQADTYFLGKYGASAWASILDTDKEALLITAYKAIKNNPNLSVSADDVTEIVRDAQCEFAWFWYNWHTEIEQRRSLHTQGVREFTISKFSEKLEQPEFPSWISDLLAHYQTNAGGVFIRMKRDFE